jgi:hypothetical protein
MGVAAQVQSKIGLVYKAVVVLLYYACCARGPVSADTAEETRYDGNSTLCRFFSFRGSMIIA